MARLFDGTSYDLTTTLNNSAELVVKRPGEPEIERVTLQTLARAVGGTLRGGNGTDGLDGNPGEPGSSGSIFITQTVIDDLAEQLRELKEALEARVGANEASLTNIYTTHATNTYVLSQSELTRQASTADAQAYVNSTLTAYATNNDVLAAKTETLNAAIGAASAAITSSLTSYATQAFAINQAQTKANVALEAAEASFAQTLTSYVTETRAETIKEETLLAAFEEAEAGYTEVLDAFATKDYVGTTATSTLSAANAYTNGQVVASSGTVINALNEVYTFWGIKLDVNGKVIGRIKLDGTAETSTFEISVDALRLSHPSAPNVFFRTVSRAVGSDAAHIFGAGTAFNFNQPTPAVLYGPAHALASTYPLNVCAVREGVVTVLVSAHIDTSGGNVTIYCKVDGGPPIVLGAFSPQAVPVSIVRGADIFYGISPGSKIEFFAAPCNGLGAIIAESHDATTAHRVAIDVLSFNV